MIIITIVIVAVAENPAPCNYIDMTEQEQQFRKNLGIANIFSLTTHEIAT